jgi:[protein-PII] uridylyltransferase
VSAREATASPTHSAANAPPLDADAVRAHVEQRRRPLLERVAELPGPALEHIGQQLGREHAAIFDDLLARQFDATVARLERAELGTALAGVGGYGRGTLALGADLDLRVLTDDTGGATALAEALLYPLWDAGLDVGHQVVGVDDLLAAAREDLPTATCLLDWRHVAGDAALSQQLRERAAAGVFSASELSAFLDRLERAVAQRHRRFGGSVYLLEPDVRNGPGALRDVDVARWASRARWGASDLDDLIRLGVLVPRQVNAVALARERLWCIRNLLHALAGRRSDRLSFDQQEAIVEPLGYRGPVREAVERLMSDYYRAARTVSRFRDLILERARPTFRRRRPVQQELGHGVLLFDGEAMIGHGEQLRQQPVMALRVVEAALQHTVPLRASSRRLIVDACGDEAWCESLRADPEAGAIFRRLVCHTAETALKRGTAMREIHDLGLLLAMIPEFAPVVGRVHHDTYHVYTVDVHSVAAVDRLGEIIRGEVVVDDEQRPHWAGSLACRLATEIVNPCVMFFSTLLHDVGKAIGGRDHSERGAEMAQPITERLGLTAADTAAVCRLVRHHLSMYLVATRRDIDDPTTVSEFAGLVGNREGLRNLYLLTVSDLSTTSPTSMTSWKARMLDELFIATDRHFRDGAPEDEARLEAMRRDVLALNGEGDAARDFADGFMGSMPRRYLLSNPAQVVQAHAELTRAHLAGDARVSVALMPGDGDDAQQVGIVADDRPGVLAAITAALASSRLGVHAAQIYSLPRPGEGHGAVLAVDLFWVHHSDGAEGVRRCLPRLTRELEALLDGSVERHALERRARPRRRAKSQPPVPTRVLLDNRASPRHSVVEVIARDRPGLLFALAETLYQLGLVIEVAKIVTEGTRVVDVFYVSERDGKKVSLEQRGDDLRHALQQTIDQLDAQS